MGLNKKKVAIIGAGKIAYEYLKALSAIPDVEISGIYSRSVDKSQKYAEQFNIAKVCLSLKELYEQTQSEFVIVTVNVANIAQIISESSQYNWKILAEKPAGHSFSEAKNLISTLGKKADNVFVALNRRYLSSSIAAQELLSKNNSRRIVEIYDQQSLTAALAAGHPQEVVDNWMYANSIHLVDLANFFCRGNFLKVTNLKKWSGLDTEFVLAHIEYDSGDEAIYRCYLKQPGPWAVTISNNQLRLEMKPLEKLFVQNSGSREVAEIPQSADDINYKPGFILQLQGFLNNQGIPLSESFRTMNLINKIYEA